MIQASGVQHALAVGGDGEPASMILTESQTTTPMIKNNRMKFYIPKQLRQLVENRLPKSTLIYLSSPYAKYERGINVAARHICLVAGKMLLEGYHVYCPIAHSHMIACNADGMDAREHKIWMPLNYTMMGKCNALLVAKMPGWEESVGVTEEINYFRKHLLPVFYTPIKF
jgi:Domain of unknown function (DUF1937)